MRNHGKQKMNNFANKVSLNLISKNKFLFSKIC